MSTNTHDTHLTSVQKSQTRKERSLSLAEKHWFTIFCDDDFYMLMAVTAASRVVTCLHRLKVKMQLTDQTMIRRLN